MLGKVRRKGGCKAREREIQVRWSVGNRATGKGEAPENVHLLELNSLGVCVHFTEENSQKSLH